MGGAHGEPPGDLTRIRRGGGERPAELAGEVGRLAATMASRPLRGEEDGPRAGARRRAGAARRRGDLRPRSPSWPSSTSSRRAPEDLAATLRELRFRVWSGPVEGRVRIASPYRLRAARFDHVFVASLQDGEFPRRDRGDDPFLSEAPARSLWASSRATTPTPRSATSSTPAWRCPAGGSSSPTATATRTASPKPRSPLLDDVRRLLDPPPGAERTVEAMPRDLARSSTGRRRALGDRAGAGDRRPQARRRPGRLLAAAGADGRSPTGSTRLEIAAAAEAATRAPGPLSNPAVLAALAAVPAYGGTTLEGFDVCSYRWFVSHELDPQPLDPAPDPLVQGGLMHAVLDAPLPRAPRRRRPPPPRLARRLDRAGRELVGELAAERDLGEHPAERAIARRVEGLLARFLAEEARARDRRLRALAAGGELRRGRARASARCSRSTAGDCTGRSTGSTATPTGAPSSSTTSSPARSRRARSSRSRRSCSCSST